NQASSSISSAVDDVATNQPVSGPLPIGASVYDTATVSDSRLTASSTGTYYFYSTATPVYGTTTPVSTETVTLNGDGSVPSSSTVGPLAIGSYSFIAVYSGDSNYTGFVGAAEPFTVSHASVSTTVIGATTGPVSGPLSLGASVYDTATVS